MVEVGTQTQNFLSCQSWRSAPFIRNPFHEGLKKSTNQPFEEGVRGGKVIFPRNHMNILLG